MLFLSRTNFGGAAFILSLVFVFSAAGQTLNLPSETVSQGQGNNTIVGTVTGPDGQRLEIRVRVRLMSMTKGGVNTVTNENGNFVFRGLAGGSYTIIIDKEQDYEPFTQEVDIIQLRGSSGVNHNVNIRLNYKKLTTVKPAVVNLEFANVPPRALDSYEKASELSKRGEHLEAIRELQIAIAEYPDFMMAHNEIGVQYLKLNDLDKAGEAFQKALKIKPDSFTPMMNYSIFLVMKRKFEDAEPLLRRTVESNEKSAVAHYFLGQTVANLGKFDEAEKELLMAAALGGAEMKEAHRLLAIIYIAKGEKKKAANELKIYLKISPTAGDAEQLRNKIRELELESIPK